MDPISIVEILKSLNYLNLFFKIASFLFSVGYLVYGIIFLQQQNKMEKNALIYEHLLNDPTNTYRPGKSVLYSLALLQLTLGLLLLFTSLFLL